MKRAAAGGSGTLPSHTERIRSLLSFDQGVLDSLKSADSELYLGQISLSFDGTETASVTPVSTHRLIGFDEAGRGALAGPVTVACVHYDWSDVHSANGDLSDAVLKSYAHLNDSKQVTAKRRLPLYERILADFSWGIGFASAIEIDQQGIVKACSLAASRALNRLHSHMKATLSDSQNPGACSDIGIFDRGLSLGDDGMRAAFSSSMQITKGDTKSFHVAAASILAKVQRDSMMCDLSSRASLCGSSEHSEPYGFASHKGYGSAAHIEAIRQHGPSRFHRKTFLSRI